MTRAIINLRVYTLTSRNISQLKRAIESVERQQLSLYRNEIINVNISLTVVVNTLDGLYEKQAVQMLRASSTISQVIVSKSNGLPGKGHNAILESVRKVAPGDIQWAFLLDGDDALMPDCIAILAKSGILDSDSGVDTILDGHTSAAIDNAQSRPVWGRFGIRSRSNAESFEQARAIWAALRKDEPIRLQNPLLPPSIETSNENKGPLPHYGKYATLLAIRPEALVRCDIGLSNIPISFAEDTPLDDVLCEAAILANNAKGNISAAIVFSGKLYLVDRLEINRHGSASDITNRDGAGPESDIRERVAQVSDSLRRAFKNKGMESNADTIWRNYLQLADPPFYALKTIVADPDDQNWTALNFILPVIKSLFNDICADTVLIEKKQDSDCLISQRFGEDIFDLMGKCGSKGFPAIRVGCLSHLARRAFALNKKAQALYFAEECLRLAETSNIQTGEYVQTCRKIQDQCLSHFEK